MTYIVTMASGTPYPDDELDHHQKRVASQLYPAPSLGTPYTQLQLATPHLTHADRKSAAVANSLHINALLQSLDD